MIPDTTKKQALLTAIYLTRSTMACRGIGWVNGWEIKKV